jgi:PilZ domain
MNRPFCPECSTDYVIRVRRQGIVERLLSLIYIYPFRCQLCGYRFKALHQGVRYIRIDEDNRDYQRLSTDIPSTLVCDGITTKGHVLEISMRGCTLHTRTPIFVGQIINLKLHISSDPITIDSVVVRNTTANRVGVEFLRLSQPDRTRLQLFIRQERDRKDLNVGQIKETVAESGQADGLTFAPNVLVRADTVIS